MELNAEQIKKALECCANAYDCFTCDIYKRQCIGGFITNIAQNALTLINSQEQRIGAQDMTISELRKRVEKACKSFATVVMLIPARTDTKWFHDYCLPYGKIEFLRGRLKFGGCETSAPFPSMIVVFGVEE